MCEISAFQTLRLIHNEVPNCCRVTHDVVSLTKNCRVTHAQIQINWDLAVKISSSDWRKLLGSIGNTGKNTL